MARNAVEFAGNDANVFGALGHFDFHGLFYGLAVGQVVDHAREVVDAAGIGKKLQIVAVFGHLFVRPVAVADNRFGIDDALAVQVQPQAQNPVGRGVLRSHIDVVGIAVVVSAHYFHSIHRFKSPVGPCRQSL